MSKDIDILVYGATGFTGRLTIDYLVKHAPDGVRLAIGGRDQSRLDKIADEIRQASGREVGVLVAEVDDQPALARMCARTRVVLTTVGPYVKYGMNLAEACVDAGCDYCDITGEPEFVDRVLTELGVRARERGVRMISCCGFDSIPHDAGAYFTAKQLAPTGPVLMRGVVQAVGTFSGGTWHSAIGAMSRLGQQRKRPARGGGGGRSARKERMRAQRLGERLGWVLPMPTIDPDIVVRTARELEVYGPDFRYGHYLRAGKLTKAASIAAGVGAVALLAQAGPTRRWLLKVKAPGQGPSAAERERSFFNVTFIATEGRRRLVTRVSGGDPGYGETSKMLSECGLALVLDRERLPDRRGVLTPVLALGDVLLERLSAAGIAFEVVSDTREGA